MKPNEIVVKMLSDVSGANATESSKYMLYDKTIAFKGVLDGVGCSTIVANLALELAAYGLKVCVIDTSFLYPAQYKLLNVEIEDSINGAKDWLDMGKTAESGYVLKPSKYSSNIMVLGFINRSIVHLIGNYDSEDLVTVAYKYLEPLYDVLLVDVCSETTNVTTAAAIHAHTVYQVWSDDYLVLSNLNKHLDNMRSRCCNADKMRNIIINKNMINTSSDWNEIVKGYNFNIIANMPFSLELAKQMRYGNPLSKIGSKNKDLNVLYSEMNKIVNKILGLDNKAKNTVKARDVKDGKVAGTVSEKLIEEDKIVKANIEAGNEDFFKTNPQFKQLKDLKDEDARKDVVKNTKDAEDTKEQTKEISHKKSLFGRKKNN